MSCNALNALASDVGMSISDFNTLTPCCNATIKQPAQAPYIQCTPNTNRIETISLTTKTPKTLSSSVANFDDLKELYVHGNWTGPIPRELGNLKKLSVLDIKSTQLVGPLPVDLSKNLMVRFALLENERMSGSIPPEYRNWTQLLELELVKTGISGQLPTTWKDLNVTNCVMDKQTCQALVGLPSRCEFECRVQKSGARQNKWSALMYLLLLGF